jgi:hypothetical protein
MRQGRRNGSIRESGFVRETGDDKTRRVIKGVRPAPVAQLDRVADFEFLEGDSPSFLFISIYIPKTLSIKDLP